MSAKEYLKMSDAFVHNDVASLEQHIYAGYMSMHACEYAAHAINSHDELVAENERLRTALECATNHFPGAAKMVAHEGWQLVPVEPTIEMVQAATHSAVGFGTRAAYRAMLAAAPKHEGGAS